MNNEHVITGVEHTNSTSSLVRRLVRAERDPGKQRARRWLSDVDNRVLMQFGLTLEDIAALRGVQAPSSG
jgi:hypothetical protein